MAFNSYLFILVFLPLALTLYYLVACSSLRRLRLPLLIGLTLAFYAKAAIHQLPLLLASVVLNYVCARVIATTSGRTRHGILTIGVSTNVLTLLYFKYTGFLVETVNDLAHTGINLPDIALPLGLSFYTFQQIAFLVDTSREQIKPTNPLVYASSILFFPFIISGPITFYREIGPQLGKQIEARAIPANLLVGLVLFSIGLFKKTVLADSFALWVDPLFAASGNGAPIGAAGAWGAAAAYLLQIYYDFSGYSDMALGIARMLGILLPLNFFSPIRSTSIIDYWRRWHMTLGRFVNLYIFQPLSLPLSRWAAVRSLSRGQMLIVGTLFPTFLTMVIIGAWHGGRWTYMVFGAMHGVYMMVNETWKFATRKKRKGKAVTATQIVLGNLLTMVAVVLALVAFRSPDLATAGRLWADMSGLNGLHLPLAVGWPALKSIGGSGLAIFLVVGFAIAYLLPNTAQLLSRFDPALEWPKWRELSPPVAGISWAPTVGWALFLGGLFLLGFSFIGRGGTSFVYFGF
jgi:alginate O-acetyltransferase complex protein AlgI